jgi:hypothetical protein
MKKVLISLLLIPSLMSSSRADEGMWIPMLIGKNYAEMQKAGLKLTPDDIYNINKSSLKDAIVSLGFCTGEFISPEGLMLTNHHCAFGSIQYNSSVQNDYLTNGFWAKSKQEELQAPGISASVLVRIEDVTDKVVSQVKDLSNTERAAKLREIESKLVEEAIKGSTHTATLKEMFYGNQYFLYVYEKFTDVRLVGAPPSSIGKFGGDTDNWMWPRHTGDFSLFRVYMSPDGKPAPYSKSNVPYKPKHFLPVSLKGVAEKDYSMILGFPGRTNRYASSFELQNAISFTNPTLIKIYGKKLEIMKADMDKSDAVRIKLAAKYASQSNSYKYYIGQNQGLERLDVIDQKKVEEAAFMKWVNEKPERKAKYGNIFSVVDSAYNANRQNNLISLYCQLAGMGSELAGYAYSFNGLYTALQKGDTAAVRMQTAQLKAGAENFFKDFSPETDKKVFLQLLALIYTNLPQAQKLSVFQTNNEGTLEAYANEVYSKSLFTGKDKVLGLLSKPTKEDFENDPAFLYASKLMTDFRSLVSQQTSSNFTAIISREKRNYIAGLMEMNSGKNYSPDANSSLRLTYGRILSYSPADGVEYEHFTTTDGILEKENPKNEEFEVPAKLKELIEKKDFGRYKDKDGTMHVAFIGNTDITGGNSGSPVINAKGELVGCAFDGNWEAMTGDLVFDPKYKRTISVDIRYVLFIIEKFAGADNLIKEMKLVE